MGETSVAYGREHSECVKNHSLSLLAANYKLKKLQCEGHYYVLYNWQFQLPIVEMEMKECLIPR